VPQLEANLLSWKALEPEEAAAKAAAAAAAAAAEDRSPTCDMVESPPAWGDAPGNPWPQEHPQPIAAAGGAGGGVLPALASAAGGAALTCARGQPGPRDHPGSDHESDACARAPEDDGEAHGV
jgi:hypothetical protein